MSNYKYKVKYTLDFEAGEFHKEEAEGNDKIGLCDAGLFISIIKPPDGSYSQLTYGFNGETKQDLTQQEIFKVWLNLGLSLNDGNGLTGWRKNFISDFSRCLREIVRNIRDK